MSDSIEWKDEELPRGRLIEVARAARAWQVQGDLAPPELLSLPVTSLTKMRRGPAVDNELLAAGINSAASSSTPGVLLTSQLMVPFACSETNASLDASISATVSSTDLVL